VNEEKKAFVVFGSIAVLFLIAVFIGFSILDRADFSSFKEKRAEDAPIEKKSEPVVIKTPIDVVDKPTENVEPDYKPITQSLVKPKPKGNPGNWVATNDYPASALSQEREGTSAFRLLVGKDGRSKSCVITSSSGHKDLDSATCAALMRRARFNPALDENGNPIESSYANRVRWQIPS
jgi:periplasmic protein TonB